MVRHKAGQEGRGRTRRGRATITVHAAMPWNHGNGDAADIIDARLTPLCRKRGGREAGRTPSSRRASKPTPPYLGCLVIDPISIEPRPPQCPLTPWPRPPNPTQNTQQARTRPTLSATTSPSAAAARAVATYLYHHGEPSAARHAGRRGHGAAPAPRRGRPGPALPVHPIGQQISQHDGSHAAGALPRAAGADADAAGPVGRRAAAGPRGGR